MNPLPPLPDLLQHPERVGELAPEAARALLLQLAPLQEALRLRALEGATGGNGGQPEAPAPDRLLTVEEAAQHLGTSTDWLYRHTARLPFTVRLGPRQLRFSLRGIECFIRRRQGR